MAFVVEDGTGLATATSFASVAEADAYASEIGLTAWTGTTGAKQTALIKAQRYITQVYRGCWKGTRANELQALDWPRLDVTDVDGWVVSSTSVPAAVKEAQIELAVKALTAELMTDVTTDDSNVASESSSVGQVSYSVSYTGGKNTQKSYTAVSLLVAPYIWSGGEIVRG